MKLTIKCIIMINCSRKSLDNDIKMFFFKKKAIRFQNNLNIIQIMKLQ